MVGKSDRRAVFALLWLCLAGVAVRLAWSDGGAPGAVGYRSESTPPDRDSLAAAARRLARPLRPGEHIDVDVAPAGDLVRLPRVGPGLAARIVRDRAERGAFGSIEGLGRVSGVGPGLLESVRSFVIFSGRPKNLRPGPARPERVSLNTASAVELQQLPGIGAAKANVIVVDRRRNGPYLALQDLQRVSGIGPATIERLRDLVRLR